MVDPRGPAATSIANLWWVLLVMGSAVLILVGGLLAVTLLRRREHPLEDDLLAGEGLSGGGNLLVLGGGVALPIVVILTLMVLTVTTARGVRALDDTGGDHLVVEVTGHKFWWDVHYPAHGVRTGNEIVIPAGRTVRFQVSSADVIHSFWVPQLGGKIDMSPGHVNELLLRADEPGRYRGLCTEYCGVQHARMHLVVHALEATAFDDWLADRVEEPGAPDGQLARQGEEVFVDAECVRCHTVAGLSPPNDLGPDLTDFGARTTIGAGIMANNPANLGGWIVDPQNRKPGNRMPPANLSGEELQALLAYLASLDPAARR